MIEISFHFTSFVWGVVVGCWLMFFIDVILSKKGY